jgi:hypothetical protein
VFTFADTTPFESPSRSSGGARCRKDASEEGQAASPCDIGHIDVTHRLENGKTPTDGESYKGAGEFVKR